MSTATSNQSAIQERSGQATKKLCQALGYSSLKSTDLKYVALALAEVGAEEVINNPHFAQKVKAILDEIVPKKELNAPRSTSNRAKHQKQKDNTATIQKGRQKKSLLDNLVPLKPIDMRIINPYSSPDPYLLHEVFGSVQLAIALREFTMHTLREMVGVVETQNPDLPKPNKRNKDSIVQFILEAVENKHTYNPSAQI